MRISAGRLLQGLNDMVGHKESTQLDRKSVLVRWLFKVNQK
jgi:hypothetical protein